MQFTAVAARGIEAVVARELAALGATAIEAGRGVVTFEGELVTAYRACLWLRSASRVLMPLARFGTGDPDALYAGVRTVRWDEHVAPTGTLAVDCVASAEVQAHTRYLAQKTKDAICDQLREQTGSRPSVDRDAPDIRIHVHLGAELTTVSLDLAGTSLHLRNYRPPGTAAPLKETLAAAVLLLARWDERARAGEPLIDPLCGSGTLPVEAALIAGDIAPGLHRQHHGVSRWLGHDRALWRELWQQAEQRAAEGKARIPAILAYDASSSAIAAVRQACERAGLRDVVRAQRMPLAELAPPADMPPGIVVTNPPYGERIGSERELFPLYEQLGDGLRRRFPGWTGYVLTGSALLAKHIGLRPSARHPLWNGPIECRLLELPIANERIERQGPPAFRKASAESEQLRNRLHKNQRTIGRWAQRAGISCYRLYDADIPEYNVAIDRYGDRVVVQEYAPPLSVDPQAAVRRLRDALLVTAEVLEQPREAVVLKVRKRQVQGAQYERREQQAALSPVQEAGLTFLVDLEQHIDTGLFPEQRMLRALAAKAAAGKTFLNLFAYTCTASVYAAHAGARAVTSVDLSQSYLDWGARNFERNQLDLARARFIQADCLAWLERERERFGVVYLNPPSYSRSHRMRGDFDIKRDHVELVRAAMARVEPGGELFFATHAHGFALDPEVARSYAVRDISAEVVPRDYARSPFAAFRIASRG